MGGGEPQKSEESFKCHVKQIHSFRLYKV